jgi:hypothetical protein
MRLTHITIASLALAFAASPASAERHLTAEQSAALEAAVDEAGTLRVIGSVDRDDLTYALGETVRFFVETSEDAYVTIVNVGPEGYVTQLFPNAFQSDNFVAANQRIAIPAEGSGAQIRVAGPVGAELIKIFASNEPVAFVAEADLDGDGAFRSLRDGVASLVRNLEVVAEAPPDPERKVAVHNLVLRTVAEPAAEGAASPSFVAVPRQEATEEAAASDTDSEATAAAPAAEAPAPTGEEPVDVSVEDATAPAAAAEEAAAVDTQDESTPAAAPEEPAPAAVEEGTAAALSVDESAPTAALEEPAPAAPQAEPAFNNGGY